MKKSIPYGLYLCALLMLTTHSGAETGDPPEILWHFQAGRKVMATPAVVADSLICITERDGAVSMLMSDGTLAWQYQTGRQYISSPVISPDNTVYVRSEHILTALDADGTLKWEYAGVQKASSQANTDGDGILKASSWGRSEAYAPPALGSDGTVYVTGRGNIYAIDSSGSLLWEFSTGSGYELSAASVGLDGTVYFSDTQGNYYALQPDGVIKWKYSWWSYQSSGPALDFRGRIYIAGSQGILCLDPDGSFRWYYSTDTGAYVRSQPVIGEDGTIYACDEYGVVHAINESGTVEWRYYAGYAIRNSSPALGANGLLYAAVYDGRLIALYKDGSIAREYIVGGKPVTSPVITENGLIITGGSDGDITAVKTSAFGYSGTTPWPCEGHDNAHSGRIDMPSHLGLITGTVTDSETGEPVAGMIVTVNPGGYIGVSDNKGRYSVYGLPEGSYTITADIFGYLPSTQENLSVIAGQPLEIDFAAPRDRKWIRWKFHAGGSVSGTPAIDQDGTVYIGCSDVVYALNPDGTIKWTYDVDGSVSTVVIGENGLIYFGAGNKLYGLDNKGNPVREFLAEGGVHTPSVGRDGTVYFGCGDKNLYAVGPDDELKWKLLTNDQAFSQPSIGYNGTVYFNSGNVFFAADFSGEVLWTFSEGKSPCQSSVIGQDGTIYVGSNDKNLFALNPDGTQKWFFNTGTYTFSLPVIGADGTVYIGTDHREFFALSSNGRIKWKYSTQGTFRGTAAIGRNGIIYAGDERGMMYALTDEGLLTWRFEAQSAVNAGAISPDGTLYFGTSGGFLYAIQTRSYGYDENAPWPCYGKNNKNNPLQDPPSGTSVINGKVTNASDGSGIAGVRVRYFPGGFGTVTNSAGEYSLFVSEPGTYSVEASLTGWITETNDFITISEGQTATVDFALKRDKIWIKWKLFVGSPYEFRALNKTLAIDDDGTIFIQTDYSLTAVNPDGTLKWRKDTELNVLSSPSIADDGTIVTSDYSTVYSLQKDGTLNWKSGLPDAIAAVAIAKDGTFYYGSRDDNNRWMWAITPGGTEKWKFYTGFETFVPPVIGSDDTVYIGGWGRGIFAVTPEGEQKWIYSISYDWIDSPPAIGPDNTIYAVQKAGYLHAIQPDGKRKWMYAPPKKETYSSPVVGPDNTVYYTHGSGNLYALNPEGEVKWSYYDYFTKTAPVLGADGTVYTGNGGGEVLAFNRDGTLEWDIEVGGSIMYAPKLVPDGTLYAYNNNGYLYAIQTESYGYPEGPCWPCIFGNNRNTNRYTLPETLGTITGNVQDSETGGTIPNALISIDSGNLSTTTNTDGYFSISGLEPGTYTVTVSAFGYQKSETVEIVITGSETKNVTFDLLPDVMKLKWIFNAVLNDERPFEYSIESPVSLAEDGTIYFSNRNSLCAVTQEGKLKWTADIYPIYHGASVASDGTIYTGTEGDCMYALNPDGTTRWKYDFISNAEGTPAIGPDGTVYSGCSWRRLYALNSDGTLQWEFETDHVTKTPTIDHDGTIYVGTNLKSFYAVNPDGTLKWEGKGGSNIAAALGSDGTVYTSESYTLHAYDRGGTVKWSFNSGAHIASSPTIDSDDTIYVGNDNGRFCALNADGTLKWEYKASGSWLRSSAIGSDNTIYFGDSEGILYALNPDGTVKWTYDTGGAISGPPVISPDGVVYVGNLAGLLYAIQTGSYGYKKGAPWPCYGQNSRRTSCAVQKMVSVGDEEDSGPGSFTLGSNYPNPFNTITSITISVPYEARVTLDVYNIEGQRVDTLIDKTMNSGRYKVNWDAVNVQGHTLASGIYIVRMRSGRFEQYRKMMFVR